MKWWPVLAVAVTSSALATVINFATESPAVWPLWVGVVVLTLGSAFLSHCVAHAREPVSGCIETRNLDTKNREVGIANMILGDVSGTVIQAGDINGGVNLRG